MIKAYLYSRYSTQKQSKGDSERRQFDECVAFANERLGVPIDTSLKDHGVSGYTGANRIKGALGSFLTKVQNGEIARGSYLMVDSIDRVSREQETQVLHLLSGLSLAGIRFVDVSEKHILPEHPDMSDWIRLLVGAARSHKESAEKTRKIVAARQGNKERARAGQGWHLTGPHWLDSTATGKGKDRVVTYTVNTARAAVVQRIFDWVEAGIGSTVIAQRLNADPTALPPRHNQKRKGADTDEAPPVRFWHHSAVLEIAKNRAVIGIYQPKFAMKGERASRRPKDGDPIHGYYPPIIDEAQFIRVQAALSSRHTGRRQNAHSWNNLFIGLGLCSECGGKIGFSGSNSRANPTWNRAAVLRCYNASMKLAGLRTEVVEGVVRPRICTNTKRYRYDEFETAVILNVADFELPNQRKRDPRIDALAIAQDHYKSVEGKIANLVDQIEDGVKGLGKRLDDRQAELEATHEQIQKLMVGAAKAEVPLKARLDAVEAMMSKMAALVGDDLYDLRSAINASLKEIVDVIDFDPDGSVRVVIAGGARGYEFRDGVLTNTVNLMPVMDDQLRAGLSGNDPAQLEKMGRFA